MYVTLEGAVSHIVLYSKQLSIACNQVSFYADNLLSNYNAFNIHIMYKSWTGFFISLY